MQTGALKQLNWRRGLWLTALLFLFNPNVHGFDLLPDAVGCLLLLWALRRLSFSDESFAEGARGLRRLALLSVLRLVATVWILWIPSPSEQPTLQLSLCFVAGVLELLIVFPMCRQLFGGLSYMGMRMGGSVVFASAHARRAARLQKKYDRATHPRARQRYRRSLDRALARMASGDDITDRACLACQMFAVAKTALCVLPELSALSDASYRQGVIGVHWYRYVGGFRFLAITAGMAVGVWWMLHMIRYFRQIEADATLWENIEQHCSSYERAHPERYVARHLKRARVLLLLGCVGCIQFYVGGLHLLPSMLAPLLWMAALLPLRRYLPRVTVVVAALLHTLHVAVASVSYVISTRFFLVYDISALYRNERVYSAYQTVCAATVAEAVASLLSVVGVSLVMCSLIARYTGAHDAATHHFTKEQMVRLRRRRLRWHLLPVALLALVTAAAHTVYYYLLPVYDFMWLVDVLAVLLFIVFATLRLRDAFEELDATRMSGPVSES